MRGSILAPLAMFFFDALAHCMADPNSMLPRENPEPDVAKKPYGWSPGCDSLGTSVCLLLAHQPGYVRQSHMILNSPFAFLSCHEGLAKVVRVRRFYCCRQRKYFQTRGLGAKCPECGLPLTLRRERHLLSTEYLEQLMRLQAAGLPTPFAVEPDVAQAGRAFAAPRTQGSPSDGLELDEALRTERKKTWQRVRRVWRATM